jgi:hypothetical protein
MMTDFPNGALTNVVQVRQMWAKAKEGHEVMVYVVTPNIDTPENPDSESELLKYKLERTSIISKGNGKTYFEFNKRETVWVMTKTFECPWFDGVGSAFLFDNYFFAFAWQLKQNKKQAA